MRAYTDQVAAGVDESEAMRDAGWLPNQEPTATAEPGAVRLTLIDRDVDVDDHQDVRHDGGRGKPAAAGPGRVIEGDVLASKVHLRDEVHFPGQLAVEAGAVTAAVAEDLVDHTLHTALPAAATLGRA